MSAKLEEFQLDGNRSVCGPRVPPLPACGERSQAKRAGEGGCPRTRPLRNAPHPDPLPASGERECIEIQARSARARRKRSSYLMALIWLKIASAPISLA